MKERSPFRLWLREIRADFLVLSVVLVMIGGAAAWRDGAFYPVVFIATLVGVVLAHISVNLFNEYSDWKTGIDARTTRTPFSGGSGNLPAGLVSPAMVKRAAWLSLLAAGTIGLWLAWRAGWPVLVLMGVGGLVTVCYSDVLVKWMFGELASGITLGSFVVAGSYFVQTGAFTTGIMWASIPPGLLTLLLLFLNEFPDAEADRFGGRRHLVIVLGKRRAGIAYAVVLVAVFLVILLGVALGGLPATLLVSFLTFPLAIYTAVRVVSSGGEIQKLLPALGMNVVIVLATDFLMAVGFLIG